MKIFTGKVKSVAPQKTIIVEVERFHVHPVYERRTKRTRRYPVHDEIGVSVEDLVEFKEVRPISKTKRWVITRVIKAGIRERGKKVKPKEKKKGL